MKMETEKREISRLGKRAGEGAYTAWQLLFSR